MSKIKKLDNIVVVVKKYAIKGVVIAVFMLTNALLTTLMSSITVNIFDKSLLSGDIPSMLKYALFYLLCGVSQGLICFYQNVLSVSVGQKMSIDMKQKIFNNLFLKNGNFFNEFPSGELQQIINGDTQAITSFFMDTFFTTISNVLVSISMICYLAFLQWDLLVVVILLQPAVIIIQRVFAKKVTIRSEACRISLGRLISFVQQVISFFPQYIMLGMKKYSNGVLKERQKKMFEEHIKMTKVTSLSEFLTTVVSLVMFAVLLGVGSYKISSGHMTIGILVAFIQFSQSLMQPIFQIFGLKVEFAEILPSIDRVNLLLSSDTNVKHGNKQLKNISVITFKNVDFSYSDNSSIISNFSMDFKQGNFYCITGPSGIGKTSICYLLLRLWDCKSGVILIDGIPINQYNDSYYDYFSYISQDPFILNDSIKTNICLGDDNGRLKDAIEFSNLEDFVSCHEQGIDYLVSDQGTNLSSGQRLRFGIARAFVRNSPVTIFDEPTSTIGKDNAKDLISKLNDFKKDKILIVLTHDNRVVEKCDYEIKLKGDGKIEILDRKIN